MISQYRVDDCDFEIPVKTLEALRKTRKVEDFLLSNEVSKEVKKQHIQGWVIHNMTDNSYRVHMAKKHKDKGTKQKCFTIVRERETCMSYIIKNRSKGATKETISNVKELDYLDIRYSYREEDLVMLYNSLPFFIDKKDYIKEKKEKQSMSFHDKVYEKMKEECIETNIKGEKKIVYEKLLSIYLSFNPKTIDNYLVERNLNGLTNRLENEYKHKDNRRLRKKIQEDLYESRYHSIYFDK